MKRLLYLIVFLIILLAIGQKFNLFPQGTFNSSPLPQTSGEKEKVVYEESVITDVVQKSLSSVVTVAINTTQQGESSIQINPFNPFVPFEVTPAPTEKVQENIGSGFIISSDGLIITNRHVVSDSSTTYTVITNDKKKYNVTNIYRDPLNDIAILKISVGGLTPLPLGDSSNLKLGQLVIAIGTPLGQFTNTVTNGIISGLGRGITAGSPLEGAVEKLDNVIQTNAAINPGNSGGPLLNSTGQVIGINTALAQSGQNIGFAIPVNVIKEVIDNFRKNGSSFERPYIGIRYQMIDPQTAKLNSAVEGAQVVEVVANSPADRAGIKQSDIITTFDNKKIDGSDQQGLTKLVAQKKIGDRIGITIWRSGQTINFTLNLEAYK